MKDFIRKFLLGVTGKINSNRGNVDWLVKNGYDKEYQEICYLTSFLNKDASLAQRIYHIMHDISEIVKCKHPECVQSAKFSMYSRGYKSYCSPKCGYTSPIRKEKNEATCLERYGVRFPTQSPEIQQKTIETNLERYGVTHAFKAEEIKNKIIDTCREKYGTDYAFQSDEVREKAKKTILEKFGVDNVSKAPEIKQKKIETSRKNYGTDHTLQAPEVREAGKKTMLEKFGYENVAHVPEIIEKKKQNSRKKYGTDYPSQNQSVIDKGFQTRYGMTQEEFHQLDSEKEKFYSSVTKITNRQPHHLLENYEKWGNEYHLDHKFSRNQGFYQGVPPEIIGHIENLEFIPALQNTMKREKCSISLEDLLYKIATSKHNDIGYSPDMTDIYHTNKKNIS